MKYLLHIIIILCCISCNQREKAVPLNPYTGVKDSSAYNFDQTGKVWKMPGELKEISGIDRIDDDHLACIEDEHGIIYIYDLKNETITKKTKFSNHGDFEDIALNVDTAYVLRSDGTIFKVENFNHTPFISIVNTSLNGAANTEGLCFDKMNHRLLIACKGRVESAQKDEKIVYAFDLATNKLNAKPVLIINQKEIEEKLNEKIDFAPSAIAVDSQTGDIYVIGTVGKLLILFSSAGHIKSIQRLKEKYFIQPEGICITEKGNIYISNEGRDGQANILLFKPQPLSENN